MGSSVCIYVDGHIINVDGNVFKMNGESLFLPFEVKWLAIVGSTGVYVSDMKSIYLITE